MNSSSNDNTFPSFVNSDLREVRCTNHGWRYMQGGPETAFFWLPTHPYTLLAGRSHMTKCPSQGGKFEFPGKGRPPMEPYYIVCVVWPYFGHCFGPYRTGILNQFRCFARFALKFSCDSPTFATSRFDGWMPRRLVSEKVFTASRRAPKGHLNHLCKTTTTLHTACRPRTSAQSSSPPSVGLYVLNPYLKWFRYLSVYQILNSTLY